MMRPSFHLKYFVTFRYHIMFVALIFSYPGLFCQKDSQLQPLPLTSEGPRNIKLSWCLPVGPDKMEIVLEVQRR